VTSIKKRLFVAVVPLFFLIILMLGMPAVIFAQEEKADEIDDIEEVEPENLDFDIEFGEISGLGSEGELFEFEVSVTLDAEEEKYFDIVEEYPPGWSMEINPGSKSIDIPLIKIKPDASVALKIICKPVIKQEPGEYTFKVTLKSAEEDILEGTAEFTAIVQPEGGLELVTSVERLNTDVRPGKENIFTLVLKNTGSAPVEDITLTSSGEPEGWQVDLKDNVDVLPVGEELDVEVTIKPPERTIAGDYSIGFNASSEEASDSIEIRTVVESPLVWKIVGIGIIAVVIAGIAVTFERLGRR